MYDLKVEGVTDLGRSTLFRTRPIVRDALSGLVDGSNTVFRTTYYPLLTSGSIIVYEGGSEALPSGYAVDYDAGAVIFGTAPDVQPEADYTYSELTQEQFIDILMAGFDEMEGRWNRGFVLSSGSVAYAEAARDSEHIYVVSKGASGEVCDPPFRGTTFSASRTQIRFLIVCCEYAQLQMRADDAAPSLYSFREGTGGLSVDKSRIPANLERALERKERQLAQLLDIAQGEYYRGEAPWGAYIPPVATQEYLEVMHWQEESRDQDRTTS